MDLSADNITTLSLARTWVDCLASCCRPPKSGSRARTAAHVLIMMARISSSKTHPTRRLTPPERAERRWRTPSTRWRRPKSHRPVQNYADIIALTAKYRRQGVSGARLASSGFFIRFRGQISTMIALPTALWEWRLRGEAFSLIRRRFSPLLVHISPHSP